MSNLRASPRSRPITGKLPAIAIGAILFFGCTATSENAGAMPVGSVAATSGSSWTPSPTADTNSAGPRASVSAPDFPHGYASRLVIPFLGVDLAVMAGVMDAEGNPVFPLCDVAQYLPYYSHPGAPGTTYLYAHARRGMLLSMLQQSETDGGQAMIGNTILVYTSLGWRHSYEITIVRPHATDYSLADDIGPSEERLIVQTSEGRVGNPFKLQVAASPISVEAVALDEALPSAEPRDCAPE